MGHVEHIHIAPAEGAPLKSLSEVEAVSGVGLTGDRYAQADHDAEYDGGQDLTLVEAEALERLAAEDGIQLEPGATRRNLTTRGIALNDLVGKTFWVGGVLAKGIELCEPCNHLQQTIGKPILRPLTHRAGLRAQLLTSGVIRVGDELRPAAEHVAAGETAD
jgi:MOSC domain-containing protein YiiM